MSLFSTFQREIHEYISVQRDILRNDYFLITTYLDTHGLGKPLDDWEEREGGEHGSLVSLCVDDLAEGVGAGGQPSAHIHSPQANLAERGSTQETQHLVLLKGVREDYAMFTS